MTDFNSHSSAPQAVIYLNLLEHGDKRYIRLWHKPNPFISKRLKEAAWVKYSKTYRCFVMHHTPQDIERTYTHFQGLAQVNSRYLYRPKRLRPDRQTPLLAEGPGRAHEKIT